MKALLTISIVLFSNLLYAQALILSDGNRNRQIPLEIYTPNNQEHCTDIHPCPVAILSAGYGVAHTEYKFVANSLTKNGYLVVAIQHELEGDPPLATTGPFTKTRRENWQRGAQTIRFVRSELSKSFPHYDFNHVMLIGHSNGGDISAWLANQRDDFVSAVVTLDNRRAALPRKKSMQVFSIRASDFEADAGVLPSVREQKKLAACILTIPHAEHNDLTDAGPDWLTTKVQTLLFDFVKTGVCPHAG